MLPDTASRVSRHTATEINRQIKQQTADRVASFAEAGPQAVRQRLRELDREWDIERALEANASSLILMGVGLGTFVDRRFLALPAAVAAFLLQHALQGWCPPLPVLRRAGFRTQREIEEERHALQALLPGASSTADAPQEARAPSDTPMH